MKAPDFSYHRPERLEEVLGLLGRLENVKLLAGGQSLMPMLNMRYVLPDHIIDLNRLPGLDTIAFENDGLRIGALVRQRALEQHPQVLAMAPLFAEALAHVGHYQTRSRGTVGGSLCHLDPAAELVLLAFLHDAVMHVSGQNGRRNIGIDAWVAGYMSPQLLTDEVLTAITFRLWQEPSGQAFAEFARRHGDFAVASVGVKMSLKDRRISKLAIAIGGLTIAPIRLRQTEAHLLGSRPDSAATDFLSAEITSLDVMSDVHASSNYRKFLANTLLQRSFALATRRALEQTNAKD
jgi:aerobic carbon-monoxide dehydrogenase medium subunit